MDRTGLKVTSAKDIKLRGGDRGLLTKLGDDRFRMDIWNKKSGGYTGTSVEFPGRLFEEVLRWYT